MYTFGTFQFSNLASLLSVLGCTSLVTSEAQHIFVRIALLFVFLLCGLPCHILAHVYGIFWICWTYWIGFVPFYL